MHMKVPNATTEIKRYEFWFGEPFKKGTCTKSIGITISAKVYIF